MTVLRPICSDCPFALPGDEREVLKARVDHGCWVPCKRTVRPPLDDTYPARIAAMAAEDECVGARMWRRDCRLPAGVKA